MKTFIKNRKGQKVAVVLEENPNAKGLAFVMHGLGGFKEQPHLRVLAEVLLARKYTVVSFDTTNTLGESEGKYENATFQNYYEDLVDIISWAKTEKWYIEPFLLVGHSLGAYCVARYAEENSSEVKAVFPYGLAVSHDLIYLDKPKEEMENWRVTGWRIEQSKSKPGMLKKLPWSFIEESKNHDLRPGAAKLTMPVLLVVGEKDTSTNPESQQIFYKLLPGPKEIHVIPDAPHTFTDPKHLEKVQKIFSSWLEKI